MTRQAGQSNTRRAFALAANHASLTWNRLIHHPELLAGVVLVVDAILARFSPGILVAGLLDESAHVATTILVIGPPQQDRDRAFVAGAMIGSVLIDLDHVPLLLLKRPLESAEDRPATHSLLTLSLIGAVVGATRGRARSTLLGLAAGTSCHFMRDLATGGVPFYWPITRRLQAVPYIMYVTLVFGMVVQARIAKPVATSDPLRQRKTT